MKTRGRVSGWRVGKRILSERDYNAAIARILELMDAEDRCETEDRALDLLGNYIDGWYSESLGFLPICLADLRTHGPARPGSPRERAFNAASHLLRNHVFPAKGPP